MNEDRAGKTVEDVADFVFGGGIASSLLSDNHGTWDPVEPADLHLNPLPPVNADGTAVCWQCESRLPFAQLDISGNAYVCRPCLLRTARANAPVIDPETVTIGRSWGGLMVVLGLSIVALTTCVVVYLA